MIPDFDQQGYLPRASTKQLLRNSARDLAEILSVKGF